MRTAARLLAIGALLALAAVCGWRVLATGMSDQLASTHPQQALEWDRHNPKALAVLARRQLAAGDAPQAAETARTLLRREPLNGPGFLILSDIAAPQADKPQAAAMAKMAIRRAPYALAPRAWLAGEQLGQGHYPEALENLDQILRLSGAQHERLFPMLIKLGEDAEFADALAQKLATHPRWRNGFIASALSQANSAQLAAIFSALQRRGDLDAVSTGRWIDRLVKDGQWGEAYARWVGGIGQSGSFRLSHVYNGGFENAPSGVGFDWRIGDSAGVIIDRAALVGTDASYALRLTFLGRRVDAIPLHQWLMLAAGRYRLRFQAAAHDLRSDRGVQWMIRCLDDNRELAASERLDGNFDGKPFEVDFSVPAQGCQAQDLWLRNAGAAAAGKIIRGVITFDDIAIDRLDARPPPASG